jgi:crescentin
MSKLGGLFARKAGLYDGIDAAAADAPGPVTALPDSPLELDEELFSTLGAQLGGENEELRNLLIDASAKIGELDSIKAAVDRLVAPVGRTLRAIEIERAEKLSLQTVLNNTRTAYGKLRNEVGDIEKKTAAAEQECEALRQELASTQTMLHTAEATKAEIAVDIAARRAQIANLEARLTQESGEARILREENKRLDERLAASEKRVIALEAEANAARQRLTMAEDEKQAQQTAFEKASGEAAKLARKLAETEAALAAAQGRIRGVEANFAELSTERARLASTLDENTERHEHEMSTQRMRFDTLQARAAATEKLLIEAREHLIARAEEIREYNQRNAEMTRERDALQTRIADLESERHSREAQHQEVEQSRNTLMERSAALARAYNAKEGALARAEEAIVSLHERIASLEASLLAEKQSAEQTVEELNTALRREKMQRAVVEGALETARKDYSRAMRDVAMLKREHGADEPTPLHAANAA